MYPRPKGLAYKLTKNTHLTLNKKYSEAVGARVWGTVCSKAGQSIEPHFYRECF